MKARAASDQDMTEQTVTTDLPDEEKEPSLETDKEDDSKTDESDSDTNIVDNPTDIQDVTASENALSAAVTIPVANGNIYFDAATGTITSADKTITVAEIPAQVDGVSVVSIANYAFDSCTLLAQITLPETLTSIGYLAFRGCTALTSVTIPASVSKTGNLYGLDDYSGLWFYGCTNLTQITLEEGMTVIPTAAFGRIPTSFTITIPSTITTIGTYAFSSTGINSVVPAGVNQQNTPGVIAIPATVTSMGSYVFQNCTNLTSISWPETLPVLPNYTFQNCTALTSITLPETLTSIGYLAFRGCTALTGVTIPASVSKTGNLNGLDDYSGLWFYGCTNLTQITLEEGMTVIPTAAFGRIPTSFTITIPSSVTTIGTYAFSSTGINSVVPAGVNQQNTPGVIAIPASVTSMGSYVFQNCTNLTSISWPETLPVLPNYTFQNCTALTSITLPETLTSIGYLAFRGCTALTSVTLPASVSKTGNLNGLDDYSGRWFSGCTNLIQVTLEDGMTVIPTGALANIPTSFTITIPDTVTTIGNMAFANTGITAIAQAGGNSPGVIAIPATVTTMGSYVFQNCTNLTSISWPETLPVLPNYTFQNCTALTSITLPETLTSIGYLAFRGCTALTSITIPASVNKTGREYSDGTSGRWFSGCTNLTQITLENGMTIIPIGAFADTPTSFSITIPDTVTTIGNMAFANTGITAVAQAGGNSPGVLEIPATVTTMGTAAFKDCKKLLTVSWPETLPKIPDYTFQNCTALTKVILPSTLTSIGYKAFDNCPMLGSMVNATIQYLSSPVTSLSDTSTRVTVVGNPSTYYAELYCSWDNENWFLKGSSNVTITSGSLSGYADIGFCIFLTGDLYTKVVVYNSKGGTKLGEFSKTGYDSVTTGVIEKYDWYTFIGKDASGVEITGYISAVGADIYETTDSIYAIAKRNNESIWYEYTLENGIWSETGATYNSDPIKNAQSTSEMSSMAMAGPVSSVKDHINEIIQKVTDFNDLFFEKTGINKNDLSTSDLEMIVKGLYSSIDENLYSGVCQADSSQPYSENYYYLRAKCFADAMFYCASSVASSKNISQAYTSIESAEMFENVILAINDENLDNIIMDISDLVDLSESTAMSEISLNSTKMVNKAGRNLKNDITYLKATASVGTLAKPYVLTLDVRHEVSVRKYIYQVTFKGAVDFVITSSNNAYIKIYKMTGNVPKLLLSELTTDVTKTIIDRYENTYLILVTSSSVSTISCLVKENDDPPADFIPTQKYGGEMITVDAYYIPGIGYVGSGGEYIDTDGSYKQILKTTRHIIRHTFDNLGCTLFELPDSPGHFSANTYSAFNGNSMGIIDKNST